MELGVHAQLMPTYIDRSRYSTVHMPHFPPLRFYKVNQVSVIKP